VKKPKWRQQSEHEMTYMFSKLIQFNCEEEYARHHLAEGTRMASILGTVMEQYGNSGFSNKT